MHNLLAIFFMFFFLWANAQEIPIAETNELSPPIWFPYSTPLVIREGGDGSVVVLSCMPDPVLYNSVCHVIIRQIGSIEKLNHELMLQADGMRHASAGVVQSFSLDIYTEADITIFGKRVSWIPGGAKAGYLRLWNFSKQTKIGLLDRATASSL